MSVPTEFTSGLADGGTQRSSTYVIPAKTSEVRNVATMLDDLGLYADFVRLEGESLTNFRSRLMRAQTMRGGQDLNRLTDAICNELGLGQAYLLLVTATEDLVELEVTDTQLSVTLSGVTQVTIDLVTADADGYWVPLTVSGLASGLQGVSGISAFAATGFETLPAFLIEPQHSLVQVVNEQVPRQQSYTLGVLGNGESPYGNIMTDSVSFSDTATYRNQVTGTPAKPGEWNVDSSGRVNVFHSPDDLVLASYKYNLLTSGQTMGLVGNGARLFNLASEEVQAKLFTPSGIGETGRDLMRDVRAADRNFWGR